MNVKEIFEKAENGTLTYEQFSELAKDAKFVDLNEGNYYSKSKHSDELSAKDKQIETLNGTIKQRDTDLADLKTKLEAAGTDASKLEEISGQLSNLQSQYDKDVKSYKEQLKKQSYEFAVKEFANSKEFSSGAAKRDFVQTMIAKNLKMEGDKILGADDFVEVYKQANEDAFKVVSQDPEPPKDPKPSFGQPTPPTPTPTENPFMEAFNFAGVREHKQ